MLESLHFKESLITKLKFSIGWTEIRQDIATSMLFFVQEYDSCFESLFCVTAMYFSIVFSFFCIELYMVLLSM